MFVCICSFGELLHGSCGFSTWNLTETLWFCRQDAEQTTQILDCHTEQRFYSRKAEKIKHLQQFGAGQNKKMCTFSLQSCTFSGESTPSTLNLLSNTSQAPLWDNQPSVIPADIRLHAQGKPPEVQVVTTLLFLHRLQLMINHLCAGVLPGLQNIWCNIFSDLIVHTAMMVWVFFVLVCRVSWHRRSTQDSSMLIIQPLAWFIDL